MVAKKINFKTTVTLNAQ